jgi:hypothetical protein
MTNRIQIYRSSVAGARPVVGARSPGELYINFADGVIGYIDIGGNPIDLGPYLSLAGGTMTGPLVISTADFVLGGGALNDVLQTDGAGGLSWGPVAAGAADIDRGTY